MIKTDLSELKDFKIGQTEDKEAMTGVTVIISEEGAVTGVDVRGGSPGTRDTDALDPKANREFVHAVVLAGGSAFGMDACSGVMEVLERNGIGRPVRFTVVPNVCAAVLFDFGLGSYKVRPDKEMGIKCCETALRDPNYRSGNYGAGTGATLGKRNGIDHAMKGGIGCSVLKQGELVVGAVMAVNCVGDVRKDGKTIAGTRDDSGKGFLDPEELIVQSYDVVKDYFRDGPNAGNKEEDQDDSGNTVIGCIMTNAILNKAQANKLASHGHNGLARAIYPAHTVTDGDTIFAMASGKVRASFDAVAIMAARACQEAIVDAVMSADSVEGLPAAKDMKG